VYANISYVCVQGAALKRERERVSEVEESYQEAVGELEGQLEEAHAGRDEMEQELEQREAEVEQVKKKKKKKKKKGFW
jgi:hypothetical protein